METFWGLLNYRTGNTMSWIQFTTCGDSVWSTLLYSLFAFFVSNLVIEVPLTALKLYDYYGPQPFQFYPGGFPLWWLFTNLGGVASGVLLALAVRRYGVRGTLLAVPLVPCAFGAWEMWAGWPTFVSMTMGVSPVWSYVGAVCTILLSLGPLAAIVHAASAAPRDPASVTEQPLVPAPGKAGA